MSGFSNKLLSGASSIPIGMCVQLQGQPADGSFLPVGTVVKRAAYPELSALYPDMALAIGSSVIGVFGGKLITGAMYVPAFGLYVAVVCNTTIAYYSENGVDWTQVDMPSASQWRALLWTGTTLIAYGQYATAAQTVDGINWTAATMSGLTANDVVYSAVVAGPRFVIGENYSTKLWRSTDGLTWTYSSMSGNGATWVVYGNERCFVVPDGNSACGRLLDGSTTLTTVTMPGGNIYSCNCFGNGKFIAAGNSVTVAQSSDTITWTSSSLPSNIGAMAIEWHHVLKKYIMAGNSAYIAISSDGVHWQRLAIPVNPYCRKIFCLNDGRFILFNYGTSYSTLLCQLQYGADITLAGTAGYYVKVR